MYLLTKTVLKISRTHWSVKRCALLTNGFRRRRVEMQEWKARRRASRRLHMPRDLLPGARENRPFPAGEIEENAARRPARVAPSRPAVSTLQPSNPTPPDKPRWNEISSAIGVGMPRGLNSAHGDLFRRVDGSRPGVCLEAPPARALRDVPVHSCDTSRFDRRRSIRLYPSPSHIGPYPTKTRQF